MLTNGKLMKGVEWRSVNVVMSQVEVRMLKSIFRFRLINRWRFCFVEVDPQTVLRCFVYLEWLWHLFFFPFLSTESHRCHLLKLFFRELKLQKRLLLTKATWKAIHQSLMEEVVLNENGAVNFRFFFSQQRLDSKKENGRVTKVKEDEGKCSFQQANNHRTRRLKFYKQMLVLYN